MSLLEGLKLTQNSDFLVVFSSSAVSSHFSKFNLLLTLLSVLLFLFPNFILITILVQGLLATDSIQLTLSELVTGVLSSNKPGHVILNQ